jgi:hypothetical protein
VSAATGLDSLTALNVLKSLKQLTKPSQLSARPAHSKQQCSISAEPGSAASNEGVEEQKDAHSQQPSSHLQVSGGGGVTVLCSIHQPSSEMFDLFDQLILLSHGVVVYCGGATEAIKYFSRLSFPCPPLENPPEYFLDLILCNPALLESFEAEYREYFVKRYLAMHEASEAGVKLAPPSAKMMKDATASPTAVRDDTPEPVGPSAITHRKFTSPSTPPHSSFPLLSPLAKGTSRLDLSAGELSRVSVKMRMWQTVQQRMLTPRGRSMARIEEHDDATKDVAPSASASSAEPSLRMRLRHSFTQLKYLTHRAYLNSSRLPLLKGAQILQTVVLGFLVGLAFLGLGKDQVSVQNRLGAVYFINICVIFANTLSVVLTCQLRPQPRARAMLRDARSRFKLLKMYRSVSSEFVFFPSVCSRRGAQPFPPRTGQSDVQRVELLRRTHQHRNSADFPMLIRTVTHLLLDDRSVATRLEMNTQQDNPHCTA